MNKFVDLVIAGPDFSGTTTQINDTIAYFREFNVCVRDLRGTEIDALFHAEMFKDLNHEHFSLREFLDDPNTTPNSKSWFLEEAYNLLSGRGYKSDLLVASMVKNDITTYINPDSADVWIMEEPTRRSAGQVNRVIEQNRCSFGSTLNGISAALAHQAYRTDEFLRFRAPLRDAGKVVVRSRSEESASYQAYDVMHISTGMKLGEYLRLPGHEIAFSHPPTHIFVVCGPVDWSTDEYIKLKTERTGKRVLDDHENNIPLQLLVNQRYATNWIEKIYKKGCAMYGSQEPMILRFDIYNSKDDTRKLMREELRDALSESPLEDILKNNLKN